jgi:hypothetical protein
MSGPAVKESPSATYDPCGTAAADDVAAADGVPARVAEQAVSDSAIPAIENTVHIAATDLGLLRRVL